MSRISGDLYVNGALSSKTFSAPAGSIADNAIAAGSASSYVTATKLRQQRRPGWGQPNSTATTETRTIFVCYGTTGSVDDFRAGSIALCAGSGCQVTVDLKKNGSSILSAPITLTSANTARVAAAGTIVGGTLVAGDWLEVVIAATASGGTLATGVFCEALITEDPQ